MKFVPAVALKKGDVLALPFGKQARIITDPKVGTKYVSFRTVYGSTRLSVHEREVALEGGGTDG